MHLNTYTHTQREREREREIGAGVFVSHKHTRCDITVLIHITCDCFLAMGVTSALVSTLPRSRSRIRKAIVVGVWELWKKME
jgi:hypothetical protein